MSISAFKPRIDARLDEIFEVAIDQAEIIDHSYAELLGFTRDQLLRRGKRLRPFLTYTAFRGCGGEDTPDILTAAASQEFFHHYLLLHDDVMDRDLVRHGGLNVAGTYRQRFIDAKVPESEADHYAASYAILAGNASCALGLQALSATGFVPKRKFDALESVHRMLFEEMGGQLIDIGASIPGSTPPTLDQLLRICRYKTASYTFETPLVVGASLAGAEEATITGLVAYGRALGVAYQLTDDLLGVYGDEAMIGKSVYSDMREGKQTVLMHYARAAATPAQALTLDRVWGHRDAGETDLAKVRELLTATGAHAQVTQLAESQLSDALAALAGTGLSDAAKAELTELARFCIRRQY